MKPMQVFLTVTLMACALPAAAARIQYAYDEAGRLTQADYGGGSRIDYTYDANGNLLVRSASSGTEHILIYRAAAGGAIVGVATQLVAHGGSGTAVTPAANLYYGFDQWSDGRADNPRADTNVTANLTVMAQFAALLAAQGTPHWWLAECGLTNDGWTFDQAETNNPDDDPFTSGAEYIADTDPTNPASYFCITAISNNSLVTVYLETSADRQYTLTGCSNLLDGVWTNVPGAGPRRGEGGPDTMQDTNLPARGPFYRLGVELP